MYYIITFPHRSPELRILTIPLLQMRKPSPTQGVPMLGTIFRISYKPLHSSLHTFCFFSYSSKQNGLIDLNKLSFGCIILTI